MELVVGWKGVMEQLHKFGADFHFRTIKEWHYRRLRIPFKKTHQNAQGRVFIEKEDLKNWLSQVILLPKSDPTLTQHEDSM